MRRGFRSRPPDARVRRVLDQINTTSTGETPVTDAAVIQTMANRLKELEEIVERGVARFVEVGSALAEIRDLQLYRETHKTFEAYCQARWGWKRAHAYRLIQAAGDAGRLSPIGDKLGVVGADGSNEVVGTIVPKVTPKRRLPQTESQARPLSKLPVEQRPEAWERAVEIAEERKEPITAKVVEEAVQEVQEAAQDTTEAAEPSKAPRRSDPRIELLRGALRNLRQARRISVGELASRLRVCEGVIETSIAEIES